MPEYLYPGVYLVEVESGPKEIEGVPTRIADSELRALALSLRESLARVPIGTPAWTDQNNSDPGVTLLEVVAWIAELLLFRSNSLDSQKSLALMPLLKGGKVRQLSGLRARLILFLAGR